MSSKVYASTFSIKSLSRATRKNRLLAKLISSAAGGHQPVRKLFKASSDCSIKSQSTTATKQEVGVRFSENIDVIRKTLSRNDYTAEEIQACWYTREERQRIHIQCNKEIRKMNEGSKLKDKKYCSRGLEGCTTIGAATKRRNRLLAIDAVLDEQMIQWEEFVFDEDTIAALYWKASSSCQLWANLVGQRDSGVTEAYVESCPRRGNGVAPCAA
jgi:hypothetical protein